MRILVWNCRMAFGSKQKRLVEEFRPDIAVISECARVVNAPEGCAEWVGSNQNKGLAILTYGDYRVSLDRAFDSTIEWAAPAWITGPQSFFLLAVWNKRTVIDRG